MSGLRAAPAPARQKAQGGGCLMSRPAYPPPHDGSIVSVMPTSPLTLLGQHLTVFADTAVCDGLHDAHEYAIVTDGQSAYVWGLGTAYPADDVRTSRRGATIEASCTWPACLGTVAFRLDTPGGWTADADSRRLLSYALPVDADR